MEQSELNSFFAMLQKESDDILRQTIAEHHKDARKCQQARVLINFCKILDVDPVNLIRGYVMTSVLTECTAANNRDLNDFICNMEETMKHLRLVQRLLETAKTMGL